MTDQHDISLNSPLDCLHVWSDGDPEPQVTYRVVRDGEDWNVESMGTWCVDCAAAGNVPEGLNWVEAWAEVRRRRA